MNYEMEKMTFYKKDVTRWDFNGKVNVRKSYATYLTGPKKGQKIHLTSMINVKVDDLVGKVFFATIQEVNGTNYITSCYLKKEDK